jgi:two-component system sensor histidine kinase KdpD
MPPNDKALSFLQLIRRAQRGKLKVYLGYGPGVGKTWQMLLEGRRLQHEGVDIVVGLVETHGREETARLVEGLEVIPRHQVQYHGITIEDMDLNAVLARKPEVALVDELAHTNVPGSRNNKRYEDVLELLDAGIHVISTLNVQHLESLYNTVEALVNVRVHERLPDSVLAEADEIVSVDLAPEDLQQRLREGKIYPRERVPTALENFFKRTNLDELRELTLRELASHLDLKRRVMHEEEHGMVLDQVMVCLSSHGPNTAALLRYGSRLAGRLNRNWYAVYIQTPREAPTVIDATTQRTLSDTLTLANLLGAIVFTYKGEDIVDTILHFAREYRVGHIVIGRPGPLPAWQRWLGRKGIVERLIPKARGLTVVVVDTGADKEKEDTPASDLV